MNFDRAMRELAAGNHLFTSSITIISFHFCRKHAMDSLAPARSALAGLWLRPHSFHRLPSGSSHMICSVISVVVAKWKRAGCAVSAMLRCARGDRCSSRRQAEQGLGRGGEFTKVTVIPKVTIEIFVKVKRRDSNPMAKATRMRNSESGVRAKSKVQTPKFAWAVHAWARHFAVRLFGLLRTGMSALRRQVGEIEKAGLQPAFCEMMLDSAGYAAASSSVSRKPCRWRTRVG